MVLCIQRPATGPVSGGPASRPDRPGHGQRGYAGLDRGHGRLAEGRRNSGPGPRRLGSAPHSATGRPAAGERRAAMAAARCRSTFGIWSFSGEASCSSSAWSWSSRRHGPRSGSIDWIVSRRARAGTAESRLHRPGDDIWSVLRRHRRLDLSSARLTSLLAAISDDPGSGCAVTGCSFEWIAANLASNGQPLRLTFSGTRLGLSRLASPAVRSPSSPSSAGPGSSRPGCAGFAATSRARGARSSSTAPDWKCCGADRVRHRLRLHHSDSMGAIAGMSQWLASQTALADAAAARGSHQALTCARAPSLPARPTPPACRRA